VEHGGARRGLFAPRQNGHQDGATATARGGALLSFFYTEVAMLVLTRRQGEAIKIGDNITVMVVDMRGDKVRLGVEAPREVRIDREEVAERRQANG